MSNIKKSWEIYTMIGGKHNKYWSVLHINGKRSGIIAYGRIKPKSQVLHKYDKLDIDKKIYSKLKKGYIFLGKGNNPNPDNN